MTTQKRLLLVEDEPQQRESLQMVFELEGYAVRSAETAEEALAYLVENRPDILITDVKLPGMDGFSLYQEVRSRQETSQLPTIFITAYNDPKSIEHARQFGASAYITKPYNIEDLLKLIQEILSGRS
jgi:CheY-like chemotaxis protein